MNSSEKSKERADRLRYHQASSCIRKVRAREVQFSRPWQISETDRALSGLEYSEWDSEGVRILAISDETGNDVSFDTAFGAAHCNTRKDYLAPNGDPLFHLTGSLASSAGNSFGSWFASISTGSGDVASASCISCTGF